MTVVPFLPRLYLAAAKNQDDHSRMSKTNFLKLSLMELKGKLINELPHSAESLTSVLDYVATTLADQDKEIKKLRQDVDTLKRQVD